MHIDAVPGFQGLDLSVGEAHRGVGVGVLRHALLLQIAVAGQDILLPLAAEVGCLGILVAVEAGYAEFPDVAVQDVVIQVAGKGGHHLFIGLLAKGGHQRVFPEPLGHSLVVGSKLFLEFAVDGGQVRLRHIGKEFLYGEGQELFLYPGVGLF